ncbi:MAG: hypothetical protein B6230_03495 [Desulfobacteraceae bacterium 4572_89]|nr:MAG: hypothetical protein B6230_03495 [Desulfobacteraceae bacterium 4572_89]
MIRFASVHLDNWLADKKRKPLVIRGARQVGKTWMVRDLSRRNNLKLIELNFERNPTLADLFTSNNPKEILKNLESEPIFFWNHFHFLNFCSQPAMNSF